MSLILNDNVSVSSLSVRGFMDVIYNMPSIISFVELFCSCFLRVMHTSQCPQLSTFMVSPKYLLSITSRQQSSENAYWVILPMRNSIFSLRSSYALRGIDMYLGSSRDVVYMIYGVLF